MLDAALEDRVDAFASRSERTRSRQGAGIRGIGPRASLLLGGADQPEDATVPHFGVRVASEDLLGDASEGGTEGAR